MAKKDEDQDLKTKAPIETSEVQKTGQATKGAARGKRKTAIGKMLGAMMEEKAEEKAEKDAEREKEIKELKKRKEGNLNQRGFNGEISETKSPSAQILERFKKGQVLTELWAEAYSSGDLGDSSIDFESFKRIMSHFVGSVDEKDPEEISNLINNPIFKRNILQAIDKKIRDDREGKWERGEGDFRGQGIGRVESLKKCLETLAKNRGKEVARLTEKEFAEISRDRAAIKEWQIENFYPKFQDWLLGASDALVDNEARTVRQELKDDLEKQLSTIEESKQTILETLRKVIGVSVDLVSPVVAALDKQIQETEALFVRAEEGVQKEEERIKQAIQKAVAEIRDFVNNPTNQKDIEISEDSAGFIELFSVQKLTASGEGRKKYTSEELANDIYLETGMFKNKDEIIDSVK